MYIRTCTCMHTLVCTLMYVVDINARKCTLYMYAYNGMNMCGHACTYIHAHIYIYMYKKCSTCTSMYVDMCTAIGQ